jgi:hypothetical protein
MSEMAPLNQNPNSTDEDRVNFGLNFPEYTLSEIDDLCDQCESFFKSVTFRLSFVDKIFRFYSTDDVTNCVSIVDAKESSSDSVPITVCYGPFEGIQQVGSQAYEP